MVWRGGVDGVIACRIVLHLNSVLVWCVCDEEDGFAGVVLVTT